MKHLDVRRLLIAGSMLGAASIAGADTLALDNTINLSSEFSAADCNFHPQGLGVDEGQGELLFMQQCSRPIYRTDLNGNLLGAVPVDRNHITSVAADATYYYLSDYTSNTSGPDLLRMPKAGPPTTPISAEVQGYGGYPIDVRNGMIYRTNFSTDYDWSNLNQVRVAAVSAPDVILATLTLSGANGIGDIAVDVDGGNLWVLEWTGGRILRYSLQNGGAPLESFSLGLDGQTAGLTYLAGRLYYYDWVPTSGSTLRIYTITRAAAQLAVVPVPSNAIWSLFGAAALLVLVAFRRLGRVRV